MQEDLLENNHNSCNYPAKIPLMSSKDEAGILDIINANKQVFEPFDDFIDSLLYYIAHSDAFSRQENDQVQQEWLDTGSDLAFKTPADDVVVIDNNYAISHASN